MMRGAGYEVIPIVMDRQDYYMAQSQIKDRRHADSYDLAMINIQLSRRHIRDQLAEVGLSPVRVQYENFVTRDGIRKKFFKGLGFPEPAMTFYNANEAYK